MTLAVERTVSRNDPCPCGSGRRYKDCHGSLRAGAQPATTPLASRTSAYRAPGDDWAGLDEATRDRLGAMMERALQEQLAQRVRDAERLYRAVLEQAPHTHDALHMLGVIRLGLGDYTDAEQLIRRAMALRPEYPAIATNWSLVRRAIAARDRRGVELLCEHALPLLFESLDAQREADVARSSRTASVAVRDLAIVGPALDSVGDSRWLAGRLRELLAPAGVRFWNLGPDASDAWQPLDRFRVDVSAGQRPHGERVAIVGLDSDAESWLREPIDRVLVFVQRSMPSLALERLRRIAADGARSLTLVFDSHAKARRFGIRQHVLPPPVVIDDLPTREGRSRAGLRVATIGQDGMRVAIPDDGDHLRSLAERAGHLCVLDAGPLRYVLGDSRHVACVPRDAMTIAAFLASSDVFLQRRTVWWSEDPRPLLTAMALGIPALCPRASIYAEYVDDARDGWLYDDHAHAERLVAMLRDDRSHVHAAGTLAKAKMRGLLEPRKLASAYRAVVEQWLTEP